MSSASRWATADDQSDTPSNSKQQYDAELEDVLGSRQDEEDEDESFQYTGEDSVRLEEALGEQEPEPEPSVDDESFSYEDQLADVLGQERIPEQTAVFPRAYLNGNEHPKPDISDDLQDVPSSEATGPIESGSPAPSQKSIPLNSPTPKSAALQLGYGTTPSARRPPLINAQLSRLRSSRRFPSSSSYSSFASDFKNRSAVEEMHFNFGTLSRHSSMSNIRDHPASTGMSDSNIIDLEALSKLASSTTLRWNPLRKISARVFSGPAPPLQNGAANGHQQQHLGQPTCMATSGVICIGTSKGWTMVFDFAQSLQGICGNETLCSQSGSVTALAVSLDHTFVAVGHASGYIHLYSMSKPTVPARSVPPVDLAQVLAGRAEGHLISSAIRSIGFIGARHTAVVSSDDRGLAFFHHLGQVLGLANVNVVRIIGRYPLDQAELDAPPASLPSLQSLHPSSTAQPQSMLPDPPKSRNGPKPAPPIFDIASLPLGTQAHATDTYSLVAIITPFKLLVVALKPTPRTLWRVLNKPDTAVENTKPSVGSLAWWPASGDTAPVLAFSWGQEIRLVMVEDDDDLEAEPATKEKDGRKRGLRFKERARWSIPDVGLATLWLSAKTIIVICATYIQLWDVPSQAQVGEASLDLKSLINPDRATSRTPGEASPLTAPTATAGSILAASNVAVYKGKAFALAMADVRVATVLTWADRIIALVNAGQLVEAIELTTLYYHGQSNSASASMGLAEDEDLRRSVVAPKLREIMHASIEYAFSEERLRDHTHVTPDGQGVDRTALFESLVDACLRACMACDDLDFVFSVLLERYQANGITNIFLHRVEPFILSRTLSQVPTLVSSLLIDLCEFEGQVEIAERIVFSVDPTSLDLDRVIKLSQRQHLPDCLVYIETTILQDWRTPLGRLLEQVHSIEISRLSDNDRTHVERQVPEAYKVFALLGSGLTGLAFYTGTRLTVSSGNCAREQLYSMLFSEKVPANLALRDFTNTNSSYPCLRLLLLFDSEAFLDTLDQALEDSFLDEHPVTSRQEIVDILLEISTTPRPLTSADLAFIYIFVARNLPKYPQFLSLPQQRLHDILLALVDDPDQSTLEDRQLAMEYLLSVYRPDDFDSVASRLENAGFYRVLRTQYRSLHQWAAYVHATLDDSDLYDQVFDQLAQALRFAAKDDSPDKQGSLEEALLGGVPQMVGVDLFATVDLISRFMPKLHWRALDSLEGQPNRQYAYLRRLLDSEFTISTSFLEEREKPLKERYVELLCQFDPQQVVPYLSKSSETVSSTLIAICADRGVDAAVIWAFGRNNEPLRAVEKWGDVAAHIVSEVLRAVQQHDSSPDNNNEPREAQGDSMAKLVAAATVAIQVCVDAKVSANASEDIWFKLLSTMVETNASFSAMTSRVVRNIGASQISNILPDALSALMSTSSSGAISFPKLTRRLIEGQTKASFRDVRPIFQSISEAYHFEEESLMMAKHLVDEDLFTQGAQLRRQMSRGWAAGAATCQICHQPAWGSALETSQDRTRHDAVNELMTQLCAPPKAAAVQRKASLKGKEARWPDEHDQAQLTDFESSPADAFRALVVSRTGSVFHRSCYESGNQDADSTLG